MYIKARLSLAVLLVSLLTTGCSHPPAPTPKPKSDPALDFTSRQLTGRESLRVALGVRVHADRMYTEETGAIHFKGRVFVDPRDRPKIPDSMGWPMAYSDDAIWQPEQHRLSLTGHVVVELGNNKAVVIGTQTSTRAVLDGAKLKVFGPARTEIR